MYKAIAEFGLNNGKRMSSVERTKELWLEIDQRHLKYLQHDDNVAKVGI